MSEQDKSAKVKSAYERALERLDADGIERPRTEAFSEETLQKMAEAKSRAEAKLAELEILHRNTLHKVHDPEKRREAENNYVRERRRIEAKRDRELESLRNS